MTKLCNIFFKQNPNYIDNDTRMSCNAVRFFSIPRVSDLRVYYKIYKIFYFMHPIIYKSAILAEEILMQCMCIEVEKNTKSIKNFIEKL